MMQISKYIISIFKDSFFKVFKTRLILVMIFCVLALMSIFLFIKTAFVHEETTIHFSVSSNSKPQEANQCIIEFVSEEDFTRIELSIWFKEEGRVNISYPKWLELDENNQRNSKNLTRKYSNKENSVIDLTYTIDSANTSRIIRQNFKGNILKKKSQSNRLMFIIDGVESNVDVFFRNLEWMSLSDFFPIPTERKRAEYFIYNLKGDDFIRNYKSLQFTIRDYNQNSFYDKYIFLFGIIAGVFCSIIAHILITWIEKVNITSNNK